MRFFKFLSIAFALAAIGMPVSAQETPSSADAVHEATEQAQNGLEARLRALLPNAPDAPGFAVAIRDGDQDSAAATGAADPQGTAMTPDTPFRIASVTKTFVAAAILRLYEQGELDLDTPIANLIAPEHDRLLHGAGYKTDAITVRHVLSHTGGLSDHVGADEFLEAITSEPSKKWTRTEQIVLMTKAGEPLDEPGASFHYSDTGYILLGEIIERLTDESLPNAVARLNRFDKLGIATIRWEGETPDPALPERAHQWFNGLDTFDVDGSVDAFGGGGLIASINDTARYFDALFSGRVFDQPATLDLMLSAPGHPEESPYRFGLFTEETGGHTVYVHGGFWGVHAAHVPTLDFTIVGVSLDEANAQALRQMMDDLIKDRAARQK